MSENQETVYYNPLYFDNAATTKPLRQVVLAVQGAMTDIWHNPSSLYSPAKRVRESLNTAYDVMADSINAYKDEIFFTSGGSESNNWAIQGFINKCHYDGFTPVIVTTEIEHNSIRMLVKRIKNKPIIDCYIYTVPVNNNGFVKRVEFARLLNKLKVQQQRDNTRILVSMQFANNEIGVIQSIQDLSLIAHHYGAIFHTDAVQAYGQIDIDVQKLGIDMMSVSGHKIGATKGVGFLYIKSEIQQYIEPLIYGTQNNGMRGGTENIPAIMGMTVAVNIMQNELLIHSKFDDNYAIFQQRIEILERKGIKFKVNGNKYWRLPNNLNITLDYNLTGEALIYMLDTDNIYISSGSACDSHSNQPSFVLKAIGLTDSEAMRTIRITFPKTATLEDVNEFADKLLNAIQLLDSESINNAIDVLNKGGDENGV